MSADDTPFHDICAAVDFSTIATAAPLADVLDEHSKALAVSVELRIQMGSHERAVWPDLRSLWIKIAAAHQVDSGEDENADYWGHLRRLAMSLARFTRNLVAAVPSNQERAFENEPEIRALTRYYTSFSVMQDEKTFPVTRMLAQALSNLVTSNEVLIQRMWESYLRLPEEQLILIRLFAVPDANTVSSAFVLVFNCLYGSRDRTELMVNSPCGARLCISFLDRMAALFEEEEESEESNRAFDIGYRIFTHLVEEEIVQTLYERISVQDEIVTPHQTTLLKLLDSYLQPSQIYSHDLSEQQIRAIGSMLMTIFFSLSSYTQQAIHKALGTDQAKIPPSEGHTNDKPTDGASRPSEDGHPAAEPRPLEELDLLLPKICEALVLVSQCLISLTLYSEERFSAAGTRAGKEPKLRRFEEHLKDYVNDTMSPAGEGSIECLIETLRLLDIFLPRITFGKIASSAVSLTQAQSPDAAHSEEVRRGARMSGLSDPKGFAYLKRDLVRLLGILCANRMAVQDRVRACAGIPVVLNLCVVDDRNPYLREHAIFALRNLLHGNVENQAVVNEIQPMGEWDENGVLQGRPSAVRR